LAATRWDFAVVDYGGWIDVAFSAGNFTASGAMTWTLGSSDQVAYRYRQVASTVDGKAVYEFDIQLGATTVGGTPDVNLNMALPFVASHDHILPFSFIDNGSNVGAGYGIILGGGSTLSFRLPNGYGTGNWAVCANITYVGIQFRMKAV
jgi:hypothetical protein